MIRPALRNRKPRLISLAALGAGVFCACLFGILTRPDNYLATFWPANALLLGWLIRQRRLASPAGWGLAALAYLGADLVLGSGLELALHMTAANLTSVATGYLVLRRNRHFNRLLLGPSAALTLMVAATLAAAVSALVAMPALTFLLDVSHGQAFSYWFSAELVCHITLVPLVLLASVPGQRGEPAPLNLASWARHLQHAPPLLCLLALGVLGMAVGGPGAPAFVVPALLWCALSYRPATTALITLCLSLWTLLAIALGKLDLGVAEMTLGTIISVRLGVALMAMAPLVVAAMTASRERILVALHHAAHHDALTGVRSRAGFFAVTGEHFSKNAQANGTCALMLDVDHFKRINDRHGHAAGDRVLVEVAQRLRLALPDNATLGRLGGEEFAIVLTDSQLAEARQLGERLRQTIDQSPFQLQPGLPPLAVSISMGVAMLREDDGRHIDTLLHRADQALYRAKAAGRNRVAVDD